jgi:F-type H+-transporting ATPase subunit delta
VSALSDSKVAKRYVRALFFAAQDANIVDAISADMEMITGLWNANTDFQRAFTSPLISIESKKKILSEVFEGNMNAMSLNFLNLLIDKRREAIIPELDREFRLLYDEAQGLIRATALVAVDLDESRRERLLNGLRQRTGKRVELEVRLDPSIIGGVVVRMQDTIIDGSVRGALERMRLKMMQES